MPFGFPPESAFTFTGIPTLKWRNCQSWLVSGALAFRVQNLGMCDIRLELKPGDEKPGFIGYSTISCANLLRFRPGQTTNPQNVGDWMLDAKPVSAILRGEIKNDSIELVQERAVGTNRSGCNITEISAAPFTEFMAIKWTEGPASSCGGGDVVMHRVKTY